MGLSMATGFSALVLIMAVLRGSMVYDDVGGVTTRQIVAYYYATGLVGGTVFGLLAPLRSRYVGKLVTAYVLVFPVYGGGTAAFWPMINADHPPSESLSLRTMLILWSVLSLFLAPIYVKVSED